jgi:L-fuconolactonase
VAEPTRVNCSLYSQIIGALYCGQTAKEDGYKEDGYKEDGYKEDGYKMDMNRRSFLGLGGISEGESNGNPEGESIGDHSAPFPIIDAHIHLFDPTRPQGIPWPVKSNKEDEVLYRPALPDRYRHVTQGLGVVGVIEVECSSWLEDNQWVLDITANEPLIVGTVGDLEPGLPGFRKNLERFHRNPIFRGIRWGNLWGRDLAADVLKEHFVDDIKVLADLGLGLDTANQSLSVLSGAVQLTDKVPELRVVIDHLPQADPPGEVAARKEWNTYLRELASRPNVYLKLSEILRRVDGNVPVDLAFYKSRLDEIWDIFGEDRIVFGSDWPNSDRWGSFQQVFNVARDYVLPKGCETAEKFYWKNSIQAYKWIKRAPDQPEL